MMNLRKRFGFWGGEGVSAQGLSGGICLWWRKDMEIDIWKLDKNMIWAVVRGTTRCDDWALFRVYGPPHVTGKASFWDDFPYTVIKMRRAVGFCWRSQRHLGF